MTSQTPDRRSIHLSYGELMESEAIQLFRERLSKEVHATIPKGIVGGFEFTVLQEI